MYRNKIKIRSPTISRYSNPARKRRAFTDAGEGLEAHLCEFLRNTLRPSQTLLLGLSGGLDSSLLLALLVEAQARMQPDFNFHLRAMHIHHGLSPNADAWAAFCRDICSRHHVPIDVIHVNIAPDSGLGLEAAARQARYHALNAELEKGGVDYVVLAHHQDDQAETVLLQLLRGSGAKGLSGMSGADHRRRLLRPLLDISRADLLACAKARNLDWVEDESNVQTRFGRNYLRNEVIPLLEKRFPAASASLARSAAHLAEVSGLLDDLAQLDAGSPENLQQLDVARLSGLPSSRAKNLLRWWMSIRQQPLPSTARLTEMLRQLLDARQDAQIKLALDAKNGTWLRRYRGHAYIESAQDIRPYSLVWQGEPEMFLPHGALIFSQEVGMGLARKHLLSNRVTITQRSGGECFRPDAAKPLRTLKHLLQEAGMPPWQRERLPLIYLDDTLAIVPGIGVASHLQASGNEVGIAAVWKQSEN